MPGRSGSLDMNRNSPGDSPSRESPATLNSGRQRSEHTRALARNTVPEMTARRNDKLHWACAKDVERRKFLWKRKEKGADMRHSLQ